MEESKKMEGYKAFDKNLKCRDFQYEIGKTYHHDGKIEPCESGFHFCKTIADCYDYYPMNDDTRICKVIAEGRIEQDENKYVTDTITIVEELGEEKRCNTGNDNTGYLNSGYRNSGYWNRGLK